MQKTGTIQQVFTPAKKLEVNKSKPIKELQYVAATSEVNKTARFKGLWQLFRKLITAYCSGCDKVYVFFDKMPIK